MNPGYNINTKRTVRGDPHRRALANMSVGDDCWVWLGSPDGSGYGRIMVGGRRLSAYRFVYEWLVGPVPAGLELDHLCHSPEECSGGVNCPHRRCVRPDHLEPVTKAENHRRGMRGPGLLHVTRCYQGHEFTPENTYVRRGRRSCRTCALARSRRYRERQKQGRNAA